MADIILNDIVKIYEAPPQKRRGLRKAKVQVQPKRAVDGLTLTIPHGSFTVLVGPSGCGKTTLLRMIAGLEEITEGEIRMGDINITNLEPGDRGLAMVFQNYALYPHMTVRENIEFGLVNARLPRFEIRERVQKALDIVGMGEYADRRPGRISGGQRQRVALARAISKMPECFLMDEPLSNLDAKLRSDMRTELIQLHDTLKSTFIYVTHDQIEAMTMGTNIVVMNEGRIMQQGTPTEIHNDPNCVFVARFIGDPGMNIIPCPSGLQVGFRPRDVQFDCTEKGTDGIVVRKAIKRAGEALLNQDVEAAQTVIDGDIEIDALESSVIDQCVKLLAKQNPVATDLRVVVSTMRLASTFERMGDLARPVAEAARRTYPAAAIPESAQPVFAEMIDFLDNTADQLVAMLFDRDAKTAEAIILADDKLDNLHHQTFDLALSDDITRQQTVDIVLLGRFLERLGDHAVSAARRVVYIVSGFDPTKEPTRDEGTDID